MNAADILEPFGIKLKEDLQDSLRRKGVMFGPQSSKLSGKIKYNIIEGNGKTTFQLIMPDYGEYIDEGRGATKGGDSGGLFRKNIENWVHRKGIVGKSDIYKEMKGDNRYNRAKAQLAFLIRRKIHREGFKGTGFYSEVIKDGRVEALQRELTETLKKEIIVEIT